MRIFDFFDAHPRLSLWSWLVFAVSLPGLAFGLYWGLAASLRWIVLELLGLHLSWLWAFAIAIVAVMGLLAVLFSSDCNEVGR